ncbi:hypothetical protein BH09BAC1_BH09BAC1_27260 [soil metagenome]
MPEDIISDTISLLAGDLSIERADLPAIKNEKEGWEQLKKLVANKIFYLMDHDADQLKYLLYRLDINELKVKTVLANASFPEAADGIAALIIEREMEKARTRQLYNTGTGDWLDV